MPGVRGSFHGCAGCLRWRLWDRRSRRLILARDRIGKKPLYWARTATGLVFGSEIKALLAWPGLSRVPDLAAIDHYLTLAIRAGAADRLCRDPQAAGRALSVRRGRRGWRHRRTRAGALLAIAARRPPPRSTRPLRELRAELVAHLEEAVRLRLVSDVPLGAFLSGGIDSSAVVAMMARAGGGRVKTFSIGFAAKEYDETRYARMVAQRYGTDHEELVVEPDAVAVLPRLVWHYGEPFADPSAVPTWYVAELARRRVTVALTGDGGDECFLGYGRYQAMRYLDRLDRLPRWGRAAAGAAARRRPRSRCSGD